MAHDRVESVSLPSDATSSGAIAWSNSTEGTYIPTPIVYRDRLITLGMREATMATPAISDGLVIVRTLGHVYGIGR